LRSGKSGNEAKTMQRPFLLTALLAGLLFAGASPASAATRQFDMWTAADATVGRAHAYGVVDFEYSSRAVVRGRLNDVCNGSAGDGHGAYLRATVVLDNGNTRVLSAKDTTGCQNPDGVDVWLVFDAPRAIRAVRLYLYEYDAQRNSTADTANKTIKAP
jgi:hypothetical protein